MQQHPAIFLLPLLLLAAPSFGDDSGSKLLHVNFGNDRKSVPPLLSLSEKAVPEVLCSDATFPTGTFCDFQTALGKIGKRFLNLNGTSHLVMNFPHPSLEDTFCRMTFIGARYETPARVVYENISCTPEVADQSIPPARMSDVTLLEMKLFGGGMVCNWDLYNKTVLSSGDEDQNENSLVGYYSFNTTCVLPAVIGRPLVPQVITLHLPDRIRDRPVND